ncbi:MAG: hypothetical protein M3R63_17855, partial [Actinomycetota bacterium]|nr:hypothetical protein [Actinomycetota bacterium]
TPGGEPLTGHTDRVLAVCPVGVPGPGGRTLLATGDGDATVRLWDPATGTPVGAPLTGHAGWVVAVCPVPGHDGRALLAIGGDDPMVRLWDPATGTPIRVLQVGIRVNVLCALPDGSLAIGTSEGVAVLVVRLAAEDVIPHIES